MPIKTDTEKTTQVKELYNKGLKIITIANSLNLSRPTVRKILREANLRNIRQIDIDNSASINTEFFNKIDSEEKAYFLGLMFADGNNYINNKRNTFSISLCIAETDKYLVEKFRDVIAPKHKLYLVKKKKGQQNQYKLLFESQKISSQLSELGCVPRKSLKLTFPNLLHDEDLLKSFLRGYIDGDGCIFSYLSKESKRKYKKFSVSLASTKNFCEVIKTIIEEKFQIICSIYTRKSNNITTELTVSGNKQVFEFLSWIYKDATIYMQRKFDKFLELKTIIENPNHRYSRDLI